MVCQSVSAETSRRPCPACQPLSRLRHSARLFSTNSYNPNSSKRAMPASESYPFISILIALFTLSGCLSAPLIDEAETRNNTDSSLLCIDQSQEDTLTAILDNIQTCYPRSKMSDVGSPEHSYFYNNFETRINGENDYTIIWTLYCVNKLNYSGPSDRYIDIKSGVYGCQTQVLLTMNHFASEPLRTLIERWAEGLPYQCPRY